MTHWGNLKWASLKWFVIGQILTYQQEKHASLSKAYYRIFCQIVDTKGVKHE